MNELLYMKTPILCVAILAASLADCFGQASGNIAYSQSSGKARAEQNERAKRAPDPGQMPLGSNSMFLEASVLMNLNADEYVAVFGLSQEGSTVSECNQKLDAVIEPVVQFTLYLKAKYDLDHRTTRKGR
jgi:hypothetical protein